MNAPVPTSSAPARPSTNVANAVSISASLRASTMMSCCPIFCAAPCTALRSASVSGASGLTSTAIVVAVGTSWHSSSSRFVPNMPARKITPVTLPPGRLRLATRPSMIGSLPVTNTIGIVVVAALAASDAGRPLPMITAVMLNQISSHSRQSIVLTLRPAVFDRYILALNEACVLQSLAQRDHEVRGVSERGAPQETNNRHSRLLCARSQGPRRRRAAEERDERASPHGGPCLRLSGRTLPHGCIR